MAAASSLLRAPTASACVGFAPTAATLQDGASSFLAAYADGTVSVICARDSATAEHVHLQQLSPSADCRFLVSATNSRIEAVACTRGQLNDTLHMISATDDTLTVNPASVRASCTSAALSGLVVSVGYASGDIEDYRLDGAPSSSWRGQCNGGAGPSVRAMAHWTSSDAKLMVACGPAVHVFDKRAAGTSATATLPQRSGPDTSSLDPSLTCIALDAEDPWTVVAGTADGALCAWDLRQAQSPVLAPVVVHRGAVRAVTIHRMPHASRMEAGGTRLLSCGDDGAVVQYQPGVTELQVQKRVLIQVDGSLRALIVHQPPRMRISAPHAVLVSAAGEAGSIETSMVDS